MKRRICIILVWVMMVSLLGGFTPAVNAAAANEIDRVEITGIREPVVGQQSQTGGICEKNGLCKVQAQWYRVTYGEEIGYTPFSGVFQEGQVYTLGLSFAASAGKTFSEVIEIVIGEQYPLFLYTDGTSAQLDPGDLEFYDFRTMIGNIEVYGITDAVPGQKSTTADACVFADHMGYYSYAINWYVEDSDGQMRIFTGTFQEGRRYYLNISVIADEGYGFEQDYMLIDGKTYYADIYGNMLWLDLEYDFLYTIDTVKITSTDRFVVGGQPTTDGASVPNNARYSVVGAAWLWGNSYGYWDEFLDTFTANDLYLYGIDLKANYGYKFSDEVTVTYNGELLPASRFTVYEDELYAACQLHTGNLKPIHQIELQAELEPGMNLLDVNVTIPENAHYVLEYSSWHDAQTFLPVFGAFENGCYYDLSVNILPEEGYYFAEDLKILLNGEEATYLENMLVSSYANLQTLCGEVVQISGDLNEDGMVNNLDVEYLLWHTLFPEDYPIFMSGDFNDDGIVNNQDVEYLLWHTLFPEDYPV